MEEAPIIQENNTIWIYVLHTENELHITSEQAQVNNRPVKCEQQSW